MAARMPPSCKFQVLLRLTFRLFTTLFWRDKGIAKQFQRQKNVLE
jgi:hypothetical protein